MLAKLNTLPVLTRLIRGWLKAGILDQGAWSFPEAGTPQGGVISPLSMNIALHGFEQALVGSVPKRTARKTNSPGVIRYADDLVILHPDLDTLHQLRQTAEEWLAGMGLRLKPGKTRLVHTLDRHQGQSPGFDFLGFDIRQYPVGQFHTRTFRGQPGLKTLIKPSLEAQQRHLIRVKEIIRRHRGSPQAALIKDLNPLIRSWTRYYRTCTAKKIFNRMDLHLIHKLQHLS